MLVHLQLEMDLSLHYHFQPKGLNPETGQPVRAMWIKESRIKGGKVVNVDFPTEMLGSIVTDKASGFKGTVTALILHISGCMHALIQPKTVVKKTKAPVEAMDIDIRRLSGVKVPKLTVAEKKKSIKKKPSPVACVPYTPGM
jgi:hypothetical protein